MSNQSHKLVRIAALACGLTLSGAVLAQDAGAFMSGSVGRSKAKIGTSPLSAAGVTAIETDDHDTGWKVNLGYQFNRHWGIELGYVDFGTFTLNGISPSGGSVRANADVTAWTLAGIGTLPLGNSNFSLFAKLGVARGEAEGRATVDGTRVSFDDDDTDVFGGIGARYDFNTKFGVQFEVERFYFDDRTYLYSLGLRYKF